MFSFHQIHLIMYACANIMRTFLICDCLSKEIEGFQSYSGDFVDKFVCDSSSEECMLGRCQNCTMYIWLDEITERCEKVTRNQWERVEVTEPGKKNKPPKVVKKTKSLQRRYHQRCLYIIAIKTTKLFGTCLCQKKAI